MTNYPPRVIDIEITNRCNAQCSYCPRDKMPALGAISRETFNTVVSRITELEGEVMVSMTGFGEPFIHKDFMFFLEELKSKGLYTMFTSNGSLLTEEKSKKIIELGIDRVFFSVSDFGEDYNRIYQLDYNVTQRNISRFLQLSNGKVHVQINIVNHGKNADQIETMKAHWKSLGADVTHEMKLVNRAGAVEYGFSGLYDYTEQAKKLLQEHNVKGLCSWPLMSVFIDWKGEYYLCCEDWEKRVFVGSVVELSIEEADVLKMQAVANDNPACKDCSVNPINQVSQFLAEKEAGNIGEKRVLKKIQDLKEADWLKPEKFSSDKKILEMANK